MKAMTATLTSFLGRDQWRGFSSSSLENSITYQFSGTRSFFKRAMYTSLVSSRSEPCSKGLLSSLLFVIPNGIRLRVV